MVDKKYSAIVTHDIDYITKYKSLRNIIGAIKRGVMPFTAIKEYLKSKKNRTSDPYYCMEEMLEINNQYNLQSIFYFMAGKSNPTYDLNDYNISDNDVSSTMNSLVKNGAIIGLHPSYESYNDLNIISSEKNSLEQALGKEILHTRQHYLRHNQETFKLLAQAGLKYDSTIGPRNTIEFNKTNNVDYIIYQDEEYSLIEQPFLLMETNLLGNPRKMLEDLNDAITELKSKGGTARIIWHNNNFVSNEQKSIYKEVLSIIAP